MISFIDQCVRKLWKYLYWRTAASPRRAVIKRIKAKKKNDTLTGQGFKDAPQVSLIVHSFNQVRNIKRLQSRLRLTCADELIVCEDGSVDGSDEVWMRSLGRPNDFLIMSNDIHEIRAYDRAIDYARGEIICLMQGDDYPPKDGSWLGEAVAMFTHYPKLGVLGGWCGFNSYFAEEYNAPWLAASQGEIPYLDSHTGLRVVFV
ncbi:MAG TPA: glycosyltransferase family A protein, partial [Gammaproteobacteria bacterium]|nr:glycosyltransferase family A protein [Gammaproteobacteria bacterium]